MVQLSLQQEVGLCAPRGQSCGSMASGSRRGRGRKVTERGLGGGEDTASQTWRPQTRPKEGVPVVVCPGHPEAWPESALSKTCRLGWGDMEKSCWRWRGGARPPLTDVTPEGKAGS